MGWVLTGWSRFMIHSGSLGCDWWVFCGVWRSLGQWVGLSGILMTFHLLGLVICLASNGELSFPWNLLLCGLAYGSWFVFVLVYSVWLLGCSRWFWDDQLQLTKPSNPIILWALLFPFATYNFHQRLVFWNSIHQEVASDSFCFLINYSWLLVFILYVFSLFFSGFNLYCWKGIHFS